MAAVNSFVHLRADHIAECMELNSDDDDGDDVYAYFVLIRNNRRCVVCTLYTVHSV